MTLVVREDPTIRKALEVEFWRAHGRRLPGAVELRLNDLGNDGDFRVSTNLASRAGIDERVTHEIVERALPGAAGLEHVPPRPLGPPPAPPIPSAPARPRRPAPGPVPDVMAAAP
jgi:hypothetical protein